MAAKKSVREEFMYDEGRFYGPDGEIFDQYGVRPAAPRETETFFNMVLLKNEVETAEDRGLRQLTQKKTISAEQIPREMVEKDRAVLEKMGFKILEPTTGDKLFHDVEMPQGWTKVRCDEDSRTMYFVDPAGNRRLLVWYKAASYDRATYGYPLRRFDVVDRNFLNYTQLRVYLIDRKDRTQRDRVIHLSEVRKLNGIRDLDAAQVEERTKVIEWAKANQLDLNDPCAHWDDADLPTAGTFPPWR